MKDPSSNKPYHRLRMRTPADARSQKSDGNGVNQYTRKYEQRSRVLLWHEQRSRSCRGNAKFHNKKTRHTRDAYPIFQEEDDEEAEKEEEEEHGAPFGFWPLKRTH